MPTSPDGFLALDAADCDYDTSRFAVLPIPYDATASFLKGAARGPEAIISASRHLEDFDEELGAEFHHEGIATLEAMEPDVSGPGAMHEAIYKRARKIIRDGKLLFGLGGDHSVTSALVRATMRRHPRLSVLQIDAHLDLRNSFEGSPFSHACVMRRVLALGAEAVVPVGIRSVAKEEHRFARRNKIDWITARECYENDTWMDRALDALGEHVYVTVDIDGFDPSAAPGTGTPEPGGLDWAQVTRLLRRVAAEKSIVGADIVEVIPLPGQVVTEYLASRLAYKIMAYVSLHA